MLSAESVEGSSGKLCMNSQGPAAEFWDVACLVHWKLCPSLRGRALKTRTAASVRTDDARRVCFVMGGGSSVSL